MSRPPSLRALLMLRLALPMAFFVIVDSGVSYYVALHFANRAYDRWLLDSARSLAQEVKEQKGKVTFELTPTALEVFQWDDVDKTFFKIESSRLGFMAGDKMVPPPSDMDTARIQPTYFDSTLRGKEVRVVSMVIAPKDSVEEVVVQVAETLNKRRGMMTEILLAVLIPQVLLVMVGALHVWIGINRGLWPLRELTREIALRSPRDLAAIPDTRVPLEVRSLTSTINVLLQRLAAAIATQQRFVANAAHQLRTPLAGLKVQVERVLREPHPAQMDPALIQIQNCANRVSRLATQLLVLARSDSVLDTQRFSVVDLSVLAREIGMEWAAKALRNDIELSFEAPTEPIRLLGDPTLLQELLNNVLDNAILYGRKPGQISIRLSIDPSPTLVIEDDGPGIPDEVLDRVCERFYRIPGSTGEGCGLGLAIVREIADLHGAQMEIGHGDVLAGTRIKIRFDPAKWVKESPRPACDRRAGSQWSP